ncbi:glycosyltransferase family 2 protein [Xylanimonas sp. McL0601]|uniref:glycosyltransferase family 2 protein n=1 Tax=Xylanimonas sp. McL0601 TaxID=3414739 RepID=UPI003CF9EF76
MPTTAHEDTWVVIPTFNEAAVVADVVTTVRAVFPHVVVVDDGSSDGSARAASAAGAKVVVHPINLGQGAALQTGLSYALERGASYLVTFDADGQHRIADAVAMVERAKREELAIVFGSRFLDGRTRPGRLKSLVLRTAVWVTNKSTGMSLTDAHNGLRVIRSDAARQVHLEQDRMAHASEIVLQLHRTRLPWAEHPVHIEYTDYSRGKGQSLWNSVNILVDLLIH